VVLVVVVMAVGGVVALDVVVMSGRCTHRRGRRKPNLQQGC
jgi:hypothetical protein